MVCSMQANNNVLGMYEIRYAHRNSSAKFDTQQHVVWTRVHALPEPYPYIENRDPAG